MHILLTNDDGIEAVGIRTLWEGLKSLGDLSIIAPMKEQSGVGVSVTFDGPLRTERVTTFEETSAWKINGTPAYCVKIGISGQLGFIPDLIVSGINHGPNHGRGIYSSGTVGGVIQGALMGIPGIAFSYSCWKAAEFPHVKEYLAPIVNYVTNHPLPHGTFLNVNFPKDSIRGVKLARQGLDFWRETLRKTEHPEGYMEFYLDEINHPWEEHPESDCALLKRGFVTAVPIQVMELTNHTLFEKSKAHFEGYF